MLRAVGSTDATVGGGKSRKSGRGAGNGKGPNGGGGGSSSGTWNPADKFTNIDLSNGNLTATSNATNKGAVRGTDSHAINTGNWYFEVTMTAMQSTNMSIGLATSAADLQQVPGTNATSWAYYASVGRGYNSATLGWTGTTYTAGDIIGVQLNGATATWYKNGVSQGSYTVSGTLFPTFGTNGATSAPHCVAVLNTGATAFSHLPAGAAGWSSATSLSSWDPANLAGGNTLSGNNLILTHPPAAGGTGGSRGTTGYTSGDKYFEVTVSTAATELIIGVGTSSAAVVNPPGTTTASYGYYAPVGRGYFNGAFTFTGATFTVGDIIGVRWNGTTLTFYKNGVSQGTATPTLATCFPMAGTALGATPRPVSTINTGGSAFSYLPSGASAWG